MTQGPKIGKKRLITVFWSSMTILYLGLLCLLAYLWMAGELKGRKAEFDQVRETYIASQKEAVQAQVRQAVHYITHKKSLAEKRVRQEVKSRTLEAHETAFYIWEKNKDIHPRYKIVSLIHDALYAASWDNGKGYYFAEDMAGTELINRNNPELEGQNLMAVRDSKGKYIMRDFIRVVQSPAGEGFSTYHWNKPDAPGVLVPKISYVKHFKPLDWVIGNGKYVADEEDIIKAEVLAYLENFVFGNGNYIFAGTFDGVSLTGSLKGKNLREAQDATGFRFVDAFIKAARAGGGFVRYVSSRKEEDAPSDKIAYAMPVRDWNWYIGTGVYVDTVESRILKKQKELKAATIRFLAISGAGLVACLVLSAALAWLLSRKIGRNLQMMGTFFKGSATAHTPLAEEDITFAEFIPLARTANRMLSERNAYEAALIKSEKKYRRLFEYSKDANLIIENEIFVDCNQATVDMLGYKNKTELLQTHPSELSPSHQPDGKDSFTKAGEMMAIAVEKGSHRFEWVHVRANGEVFPVEVLLTVVSLDQNKQVIYTTWRDITDRKKAEALMIQTEKMITVGGLAAGMAHEINNPLAGMMQSAQVIKHRLSGTIPANFKAAEEAGISFDALNSYLEKRGITGFLDAIHDTGERAAKIVRNMLNFVHKRAAEKAYNDICGIVDQTVELAVSDYSLAKKYDIRKIQITTCYPESPVSVLCDESNIQQVFFNLIKNAAQAMAETGTENPEITIDVKKEVDGVCIRVGDNGPGMEAEMVNRIFEPFYSTKAVNEGTGLGLSVSYFIVVQDHGGSLEARSAIGEGTTFIIRLPDGDGQNPKD
ncbi:MAG: cache domain-containing protein [Desulfobacterales bacterium]|nr:cache domain-containing protein [Desulfobacterales bacterium]